MNPPPEGYVGPRASLDVSSKRKTSCLCQNTNPGPPACSLVNYTEYAIPSPTVLTRAGSSPCSPIKSNGVSSDQQQSEDGGRSFLRNVGMSLPDYTASRARTQQPSSLKQNRKTSERVHNGGSNTGPMKQRASFRQLLVRTRSERHTWGLCRRLRSDRTATASSMGMQHVSVCKQ